MPINKNPIDSADKRVEKKSNDYQLITPIYSFDDVILDSSVFDDINTSIMVYKYSDEIYESWGLGRVIKKRKNTSINLYGESGTGKTITAHAIANALNKKMLFVNYGEIESKYVGETAKNLIRMFEYAKNNDCVLVFDEADALLSKRVTSMTNATDVSVNQTRNVLLRLLDDYEGVIVFTTNFISNYDKAFFRRITSHIKISMPDYEGRKRLWHKYLVDEIQLDEERELFIEEISKIDEVTGADISNAVLKTVTRAIISEEKGIKRCELEKEINNIKNNRKKIEDFHVSTRKVSPEYVKAQIDSGGVMNGST